MHDEAPPPPADTPQELSGNESHIPAASAAPARPAGISMDVLLKGGKRATLIRPTLVMRSGTVRRPPGPPGGRNKACGCGSGKKFKFCCGAPPESPRQHDPAQRKDRLSQLPARLPVPEEGATPQ